VTSRSEQPDGPATENSGFERTRHSPRTRRRIVRRVLIGVGIAVFVLALCGGWLAFRAVQVKQNLEAAMALLPTLQEQVTDRDVDGASSTLDEVQRYAADARTAGTDPLWKAAGILPVIGTNFTAISEVAVSADDVVNRAVAPMLDKASTLDWDALTPTNGRVDVGPLRDVAPTLGSSANTVQLSYDRLQGIDRDRLLPQVVGPFDQAVGALDDVRVPLNSASRAAQLLPSMLGADGPRNYLILVQNSAEIRATGGIPGALAVVTADDGRIALTGQGSATEMGEFDPPLDVDGEQEQIYTFRMGAYMQSANLTPDFPTAAETAKGMWEQTHEGSRIDGVIALDPVVLANILWATGPVDLGSFEDPAVSTLLSRTELPTALDSVNVVPTLLSDVYAQIEEPDQQDEYFAAVAGKVFSALADGQGDSEQLIEALVTSSDQGRLYLWSATAKEQNLIARTAIAGAATGSTVGGASFGAYFNDGTGAKMDYYVRRTVQLLRQCSTDGYSQYTVKVTLTNTAPADAVASLPAYVTGDGAFDVAPGRIKTNTIAYGPAQSLLQTARLNGKDVPLGSFGHGNRPVGVLTTELGPGETATLEIDFTNVVQENEPILDVTPTVQDPADVVLPLQSSGACGLEPYQDTAG
jgi:hypothetical protein